MADKIALMSYNEVRVALKARNLSMKGKKDELVARLIEAMGSEDAATGGAKEEDASKEDEVVETQAADQSATSAVADVSEQDASTPEESSNGDSQSKDTKEDVKDDTKGTPEDSSDLKRARDATAEKELTDAKRIAAQPASTARPAKTQSLPVMLKCLVANRSAGTIIGKGGSTIASLQKDSGARVQLSRNGIFFPGSQERVLLLTGTLTQVLIGFSLVLAKQYQEVEKEVGKNMTGDPSGLVVRLVVPNASAGIIIGKGGSNIKEITAKSGARVQLAQKDEMVAGVDERVVTVTGAMEQQLECAQLMLQKMHEDDACATRCQYANASVDYNRMPVPFNGGMTRGGIPNNRSPQRYQQPFRPPAGFPGRMQMGQMQQQFRPPQMMMPPRAAMGAGQTTMTVQVPDGMVGAIIGTQGKAINDIQQFSGARVQISKRGEYIEGTQNRIVTMTGTMQQCQHAQVLIQQAMDNAPPRPAQS